MTRRPHDNDTLMGLRVWVPEATRPGESEGIIDKTVE